MIRTFTETVLVLKRTSVGEADRIVTFLSATHGKFAAAAKGVRKINSSRRALLEPGNLLKAFFATTKTLPIMTQAQLLEDAATIHGDLVKLRQLAQILEIFDRLFVEEEIEPRIFELVKAIRQQVLVPEKTSSHISLYLNRLVEELGYQNLAETNHSSILDYIAEITEQPMKSWDYLMVK